MRYQPLLITILLLCSAGCGSIGMPGDFDYGEIINGRYVNSYFGFRIQLPDGWTVKSKAQMDSIRQLGHDLYAGDDSRKRLRIKAADINIADLLVLMRYPPDTMVVYNLSMLINVENLSRAPQVKTPADYLALARAALSASTIRYHYLAGKFPEVNINGAVFGRMDARVYLNGLEVQQQYFATRVGDFSFNIILSYGTEEQRRELMAVLGTSRFYK